MPQTTFLDLDAVLAPIPGDDPRGHKCSDERESKLKEARKDSAPPQDSPFGEPVPKTPEWGRLIQMASDWLANSSKDLRIAVRLVEALARQHRFAGLRDGLMFLRLFVTDCWDRMHPIIEEEEDLETRANRIRWLTDPDSSTLFPYTLRTLPLCLVNGQTVSLEDWNKGQVGETTIDREAPGAVELIDPDDPPTLAACLSELGNLQEVLNDKLQSYAPPVGELRQSLEDCQRLLLHLLPKDQNQTEQHGAISTPTSNGTVAPRSGPAASAAGSVDSRQAIYDQLTVLANRLAAIEPHSPIPDLLHWAVQLGKLPFRQLIKEMVREQSALEEIRRIFGIRGEEPS